MFCSNCGQAAHHFFVILGSIVCRHCIEHAVDGDLETAELVS